MTNYKLNSDNDIDISNYQLQMVSGNDEVLQRVRVRLRFFKGEWFLNTDHGIPYFQSLLGQKNIDFNSALVILNGAVLQVKGIKEIISSSLDYSPQERKILYKFKAQGETNDQSFDETIII